MLGNKIEGPVDIRLRWLLADKQNIHIRCMIKIFRKIRFDLMEKNKTGKYLKYAIGEIVLVVIGILIALQINNWNNEQNRNKSEAILLNQLRTDLMESQKELEVIKRFYLVRAQASAKVLRVFWAPETLNDTIAKFINLPQSSRIYSPILGTARSLINSGNIDLIRSAELKNSIISYVEKVEYKLKDIGRYEETYYRNGINEVKKVIPNTYMSKEWFSKIQKEDSINGTRNYIDSLDLNIRPDKIETVPFKSDLKELFKEQTMYRAYYMLHISHRNIYYRYDDIFDLTNDLIEKINSVDQD